MMQENFGLILRSSKEVTELMQAVHHNSVVLGHLNCSPVLMEGQKLSATGGVSYFGERGRP